jgi:hypothetical protein
MILGYTRTGKPVLVPTTGAIAKTKFANWTRGDHQDASQILMEHAEREGDSKIASRCARWASAHWDLGGRWTN